MKDHVTLKTGVMAAENSIDAASVTITDPKLSNSSVYSHTYQAMLFAMIQPMSSPSSTNDSLKLVSLHPDNLIYTVIANRVAENKKILSLLI